MGDPEAQAVPGGEGAWAQRWKNTEGAEKGEGLRKRGAARGRCFRCEGLKNSCLQSRALVSVFFCFREQRFLSIQTQVDVANIGPLLHTRSGLQGSE